jgi:hypothetical protein
MTDAVVTFLAIVFFFSNGIKDSGLYIAMLYNIKKMEVEGICDVSTSVRMVRNHSQEFRISEVNIFSYY